MYMAQFVKTSITLMIGKFDIDTLVDVYSYQDIQFVLEIDIYVIY